jgi:hypothetical protein
MVEIPHCHSSLLLTWLLTSEYELPKGFIDHIASFQEQHGTYEIPKDLVWVKRKLQLWSAPYLSWQI